MKVKRGKRGQRKAKTSSTSKESMSITINADCNSSIQRSVEKTSLQYTSPLCSGNACKIIGEQMLIGSHLKGVGRIIKKKSKQNKVGKYRLISQVLCDSIININEDLPVSTSVNESSPNDDCIIEVFDSHKQTQSSSGIVSTTQASTLQQSESLVISNSMCVSGQNQSSMETVTGQSNHDEKSLHDFENLSLSRPSIIIIEDSCGSVSTSVNESSPNLSLSRPSVIIIEDSYSDLLPTTRIPDNLDIEKTLEMQSTSEHTTERSCNQSVLTIDDDDASLTDAINIADNDISEHKSSSQTEKPYKTKRKDLETDDDSDVNHPTKKRHSPPLIGDTNTVNLLTDIASREMSSHEGSSSSLGSSNNLNKELETIDLDSNIISGSNSNSSLNNTIVLSDEDDTSDDIVVLGTPVIPSVRSYKAISNKHRTTKLQSHLYKSPLMSYLNKPPVLANVNAPYINLTSNIPDINSTRNKITRLISKLSSNGQTSRLQPTSENPSTVPESASRPSALSLPNNIYGSNIYNPCGSAAKTGLRPVIIDGSNVAMGHGNGIVFSSKGLKICIDYFVKRGHKVFAFVPKFRWHNALTRDSHLLEKLSKEKLVIFTPSRLVDGRPDVPYDDRYIVQTAAELGGVIVSTDNYRDLLEENSEWHETIKNRLLMFTWVEDLLIFPQDPLGRRGKNLDDFLKF